MIAYILLVLSLAANGALGWLLVRASKRLLQFDEVFEQLGDDVDVNVTYFKKLTKTPIFQNSPEVVDAHKNMLIMQQRLAEFSLRMREAAQRQAISGKEEKN